MPRAAHARLGKRGRQCGRLHLHLLPRLALAGALLTSASCTPAPHGTIGAILGQQSDGRVFVRDVPPDLAAAEAGIQPGDELLFVDGIQASTLTPEQLSQLLGGPVGAPVKLTLLRDGEVVRVTVTRSEARRYAGTGSREPGAKPASPDE